MIRVSFFTLGAWSVKIFRAGCLILLGASVVRLLANPETACLSRYLMFAGGFYVAAWAMSLTLKRHIGKRRSSSDGWRFWVCIGDRWLELQTESPTESEVVLLGGPIDSLSYLNEFLEVLMYGISRITWGTLILHTNSSPHLLLEKAKKTRKGGVTAYTIGSREEERIEFVEAWDGHGRRIQLRVFETSTSHLFGGANEEGHTLRVEDTGESPVVYRPDRLRARVEDLARARE